MRHATGESDEKYCKLLKNAYKNVSYKISVIILRFQFSQTSCNIKKWFS